MISWVWKVEARPLFRVIDVLLKKRKCPSWRTLAKELWQNWKAYWINTVCLQTKMAWQILRQGRYIPLCPRSHCFCLLIYIFLSIFIKCLTLIRCICCLLALANYWKSVLSQFLETLKEQRVLWKRNLVSVDRFNQSSVSYFIIWTDSYQMFPSPLLGLDLTSDLYTAVTSLETMDCFATKAWQECWRPKKWITLTKFPLFFVQL